MLYVTKTYQFVHCVSIYGAERKSDKSLTKRNLAETIKYGTLNKNY